MIEHYSYVLSDQIGKGFSSRVFKGKNEKTGEQVAIKVFWCAFTFSGDRYEIDLQ
jgi:uncharacterized membrane protein